MYVLCSCKSVILFFRFTGRVTMVIDSNWFGPGSESPEDVEAAERNMLFTVSFY